MLPPPYSRAVLAYYQEKLDAGGLSIDIRQLSPASLKAACLQTCRDRYEKKDERLLKDFFEAGNDREAFLLAIDGQGIDKFRPVVNFLRGKTKNPDDKIIELVAWLIDFKDRPYDPRIDYSSPPVPPDDPPVKNWVKVASEHSPQPVIVEKEPDRPGPPPPEKDNVSSSAAMAGKKRAERVRTIFAIAAAAVTCIAVYWNWSHRLAPSPADGQACMFWAGDHFQPIPCDKKAGAALIVPLDAGRLLRFKKITRPDTITENALGNIWWAKFGNQYEFYTLPGKHPIDTSIKLKVMNDYAFLRYLRPKQAAPSPTK
ncbi:MAG TPA: hypothetical protein VGN00_18965 [Puia sp.]|jgi:hypothetical protein